MLLVLAAPIALTGCEVGPDYHAPAAPVAPLTPAKLPAATAKAGGVAQNFVSDADISGDWWTLYHSPELNALITAAFAHNPTLDAAQGNLLEAQETVREAEGVLVPTVSGSLQAERVKDSAAQFAGQGTSTTATVAPFTLYNASLSVSYALDVWGGARRDLESLNAQEQYQRYELEAAYLSLTANIVTGAVTEASLNAQIADTQNVIAAEEHELSIIKTQVDLGGVAPANVLSQEATLAASEATLPPLEAQLAQARNQLATYVGSLPGNFHEADFTLADLHLPADLPVSLPSSILAQRPDIAAAAAQLHAASANIGVADAQMLPQVTLSAGIGHESLTTGALFTPQTLLWSLVSGLTQPIFEGGQLAAKRKIALAALQVSGAQYQNTVLVAFQNVADALQALQYDAITLNAAQAAADAAAKSLAVTQDQYRLGAQPFTAVLVAQTTYQNAAIAQVKASAARLADTAALYQALGGGWWHRADVKVACCGLIP
ncbi:MAG: efflux transporter outer membrane subunit [Acidocella sp.]|nr:efflux transporter outer membrane subunit [Acidocella sp.]